MAAVISVADGFLEVLLKSGLLTKEQVDDALWKHQLRQETAAVPIAQAMVDNSLLTKYQAEQLLRGRHRGLILDNRYKILYPVGSGGMGRVFAAQEMDTNWKVAVKLPSEARRNETSMRTRLQLEAEAGLRLAHPNILRTLEIGSLEDSQGDSFYVVMELVKGISMRELLDMHHPLPVGQVCDVICQAATGLTVAHAANLVHRDVKPENILIRSDGSVKVLDFGLAMLDEDDQEFAMAMILGQDRVGTADFVAPEQSINSYQVDSRADIYSLGCTLYFGLTKQLPFPADSVPEKIRSHRKRRPKAATEFRDDIPDEVLKTLDKMMSKAPSRRFATAEEVVHALSPFAKRSAVPFNYNQVLRARAELARRKAAERQSRASRASRASDASQVKGPEMTDTVVPRDTKVDKNGGQ